MSRGEAPKPTKAARGAPIAAALVTLLLVAGFLTLWAVDCLEGLTERRGGGTVAAPAEPFAGAHAALSALPVPHCAEGHGGPRVASAGMPDGPDFDARLAALGLVPDGDWSPPLPLPLDRPAEGLDGACGLVAVRAERGGIIDRGAAAGEPHHGPCSKELLWLGACGGDRLVVSGVGQARLRAYAAPGLTPDTLRETGLPSDVALAFADAESRLGSAGWTSSEAVVRVAVAAASPGTPLEVRPPGAGHGGCRAWIAVGRGVELVHAHWPPTTASAQTLTDRFLAPTVACGSRTAYPGTLLLSDAEHDGGEVWFRPVRPDVLGPALPLTGPRPPLIFAMRVVPEAEATLPEALPLAPPAPP